MKKYKINKSVSLKTVELLRKTCLISNKRNRMPLSIVSSGCIDTLINNEKNIVVFLALVGQIQIIFSIVSVEITSVSNQFFKEN